MGNYYYCWKKELTHEICQKIINLGKGNWNHASVVNKSVAAVRKSDIVWVKEQWVFDLIDPYVLTANEHAGWKYDIVAAEACQVTRYTKDGFYSWHRDGLGSHNEEHSNTRKLSMSNVLNSDFEGGDFEISTDGDGDKVPRLKEGSIIVFPSFLQHRVAPVTKGIRYSLVAWFLGPPFK